MINQWWFRLYTQRYLVSILKTTFILIFIEQIILYFARPLSGFYLLAPIFSFIVLITRAQLGSLRSNIEFHKMSVPFKDLRKALILDTLILIIGIMTSLILVLSCSYFSGGVFKNIFEEDFVSFPHLIYYGMHLVAVMFWYFLIHKDSKYQVLTSESSLLKKILRFGLFTGLTLMYSPILIFSSIDINVFTLLTMLSFGMGSIIFQLKAIFHIEKPLGGTKIFLKYGLYGHVVAYSLFFITVLISRNDVLNPELSPALRVRSFTFCPACSPNIDQHTFRAIDKHIDFSNRGLLYSKLDFNPYSLGVEYWIGGDKDAYRLQNLLYHKPPTKQFLISLYDHFETYPNFWANNPQLNLLKYLSYQKWPKGEKLPERFLAAQLSSKELFEQEQKKFVSERKARRKVASDHED